MSRKIYILVLGLMVSLGNIVFAQDGLEDDSKDKSALELSALLKGFDKDGDGVLSQREREHAMSVLNDKKAQLQHMRESHAQRVLSTYDKDGDKKLDIEELIPFLEKQRQMFEGYRDIAGRKEGRFKESAEQVKKYDLNEDGKLDRKERDLMMEDLKAQQKALIEKYDENKDGNLDRKERENLFKDPKAADFFHKHRDDEPKPLR